ncbi:MAG: hypothetical protein LKI88_07290, partial [Bifidobacterium sp.]|nr:hypothetical protein [Bifidobacterium sp.]
DSTGTVGAACGNPAGRPFSYGGDRRFSGAARPASHRLCLSPQGVRQGAAASACPISDYRTAWWVTTG